MTQAYLDKCAIEITAKKIAAEQKCITHRVFNAALRKGRIKRADSSAETFRACRRGGRTSGRGRMVAKLLSGILYALYDADNYKR